MAETARLVAIVGPTASGKSALALRVAAAHEGEIVSCDSLQVYRGLDIGSAKPTPAEQASVPHHLIDVVEVGDEFSAAEYVRRARLALAEITARQRLPMVVGGTGLYLRGLLEGLFPGPARALDLRARLEGLATRFGDQRLHRLLCRIDPEVARRVPPRDRVRAVRALEVFFLTGRSLSDHHAEQRKRGDGRLEGYARLVVGLCPSRDALRQRVVERTRAMLRAGLLEEAGALVARGLAGARPLQAIGYRQAVAVIEGRLPPHDLEASIVSETMRYAKRQMTWFRRQVRAVWFSGPEEASVEVTSWLRDAGSRGAPVR